MIGIEHLLPATVEEACNFSLELKADAQIIAGGTKILSQLKSGSLQVDYLIDLGKIMELEHIIEDEKTGVHIGAMVTLLAIEESDLVRNKCSHFAMLINAENNILTKWRTTIGGYICTATREERLIGALISMGTSVYIKGADHEYICLLADFFSNEKENVIEFGDIIYEIRIPLQKIN